MHVRLPTARFVETGYGFRTEDAHGDVLRDDCFGRRAPRRELYCIPCVGIIRVQQRRIIKLVAAVLVPKRRYRGARSSMGRTTMPALDGRGDGDDEVGRAVALCEADAGGGGGGG